MKNIKNKQHLIELATPLFLQYGFKKLTMSEIATHLSISKKTIYKYFSTKEDLVSASIDYNLAYFNHIYEITEQQSENCVEQIKLFFSSMEKEFGFLQFRINYVEMATSFPSMFNKASDMLKDTTQNLATKIMNRAKGEGLLDHQVDIETMSHLIALLYVKLCTDFDINHVNRFNKSLNEFIFLLFKSTLNQKGMELVGEKTEIISASTE